MKKSIFSRMTCLALAFVLLSIGSCSKKLPPETMPSAPAAPTAESEETAATTTEEATEATEATTEETEPTPEPTLNPNHGPFSTAVRTEKIVEEYGQLSVDGLNLVNEAGEPVQLRGMSSYGVGNFMDEVFIQTLAEDWCCDIFRIAMYTDRMNGGCYMNDQQGTFDQVCHIVDMCIDQGIYVIVDWHILEDGDPNKNTDAAIDFFDRISAIYGEYPNVLYEICNEPNGEQFADTSLTVDWDCIKNYAEQVIPAIRANDPDNIIIVGTPTWSQDVDIACYDPLEGDNLMYTYHFYAGSHGQEFRDRVQTALDNGLPIFVTEWGTSLNTGGGGVFPEESMEWIEFMEENNLSWCNWSIGSSAAESSNALRYNSRALTPVERTLGHWPDEFLSQSGLFVRCVLLGQDYFELYGDSEEGEASGDAEGAGDAENADGEEPAEGDGGADAESDADPAEESSEDAEA